MRKYLALAALITGALLLAGCDIEGFEDSNRFHEDFHYNYTVKPGARLAVINTNGAIEITATDGDQVDISGTKNASTESLLKSLRIDISATPDSIRVETIRPSGHWGGMGARYTIRVPRQLRLDRIQTTNGSIRAEGTLLAAAFQTTNGSITGNSLGDQVDARTTNGSVNLHSVKGPVTARTTNGHVEADGAIGSFNASTTNGHIEVSAQTLAGSGIDASTTNGSITVRLPSAANAELRASNSHGKLNTDFSLRSETHDRHRLEGTIGSGGPYVRLRTTNGSINVRKL
jgi:DUF4097 and DUF4098 domain-containing protein YvlB